MASNRSNYPRPDLQEEELVNYLPWQWAILFLAALAPGILSIWAPSFHDQRRLFFDLERIFEIGPAVVLLILPFIFAGGSLGRAVRDRINEPTTVSQIIVALSGIVLVAVPSIISVVTGHEALRIWPGISGTFRPVTFVLHGVFILTLLIRSFMPLLILSIPSRRERLSTYVAYVGFQIAVGLTGTYLLRLSFPLLSRPITAGLPMGVWLLFGIVNELSYFAAIWILDRLSFPSFKPLSVKFVVSVTIVSAIGLPAPNAWWHVLLNLISFAIVVGYAMLTNPDALRWKQKVTEESLQT